MEHPYFDSAKGAFEMGAEEEAFRIEVPEQGFEQTYTIKELGKFIDDEIVYLNSISGVLAEQLVLEGRSYQGGQRHSEIVRQLRDIKKQLDAGNRQPLEQHIAAARLFEVIVGQGEIGKRIQTLIAAGHKREAQLVFFVYAPRWAGGPVSEVLLPIRAAILGNPMFGGFTDVVSASQALETAQESRQRSQETSEKFEQFYQEKSELIARLEQLFRKKLPVEEPALVWQSLADSKTVEWRIWLGAFVLLAIVPIIAGLWWFETVTGAIAKVTTAGGTISLGGVAAITVPAVLYLWVLKNVSRGFQQCMALSHDAAHRRILAMTYLGLAKEQSLEISDNDRALILNALFRPVAPHGSDEGPPAGLIDLIKKP